MSLFSPAEISEAARQNHEQDAKNLIELEKAATLRDRMHRTRYLTPIDGPLFASAQLDLLEGSE